MSLINKLTKYYSSPNTRKPLVLDEKKIALLAILLYLSFFNLFVIKTTPEILLVQYILIIYVYKKFLIKSFLGHWLPFIGLFFVYEFLRGYADSFSPFYHKTLFLVYEYEKKLFGELPTIYLQDLFINNELLVNISLFFYSVFFYFSFSIGLLVWFINKEDFQEYFKKFLLLSFVGLVFFFLIPTAPPWMLDDPRITRKIYDETILNNFKNLTIWEYFIYGNSVAAFPSLHTAWPAFSSLFLIKKYRNKYKLLYLSMIVPLMIGFSVILTGEHYVIDVLAGWLLVIVILYPRYHVLSIKKWFQ